MGRLKKIIKLPSESFRDGPNALSKIGARIIANTKGAASKSNFLKK